ncbi:MAG: hypothetical protein JO307_26180 [Bryobacterales bacterium]|nr:hypothetical protein [Bryobacterales bacterium]MBV9400964.1 hypothetical protein [Bryobacterales bacterium]
MSCPRDGRRNLATPLLIMVSFLLAAAGQGLPSPEPVGIQQDECTYMGPTQCYFYVAADTPSLPVLTIPVSSNSAGASVAFRVTGITPIMSRNDLTPNPAGPDFIIASPETGVTPSVVLITLNPNIAPYLNTGAYWLKLSFDVAPDAIIGLYVRPPGTPTISSVVNSASFQPNLSPGSLVTITGTYLGTPPLSGQFGNLSVLPTSLGNTTLNLNGIPAPLLYVSPDQINAVVPYGVGAAGATTLCAVVNRFAGSWPPSGFEENSIPFCVPLAGTSPAIFTAGQSGSGQGAILNDTPSGGFNRTDNPSARGSYITFYATGVGPWGQPVVSGVKQPAIQDGSLVLGLGDPTFTPQFEGYVPTSPISLTIGGQPAKVTYAGAAPHMVAGMLQVNAVIPSNVSSGAQPLVLTVGQNDNSQQHVTVAVQ